MHAHRMAQNIRMIVMKRMKRRETHTHGLGKPRARVVPDTHRERGVFGKNPYRDKGRRLSAT